MRGSTDIADDVLGRVAHFLVTVLVFGGLVLGPVAHVQVQPDDALAECSNMGHGSGGHESGGHSEPDPHHDCPVCLTLASVAAPVLPPVPGSLLADAQVVAAPGATVHDRGVSDTERARAPPIS
jgi:hypothetical protein